MIGPNLRRIHGRKSLIPTISTHFTTAFDLHAAFQPLCVRIARGFKGSVELDLRDARIQLATSNKNPLVRLEFLGY